MANQGFPFPYDIGNLLGGSVRVLYAPDSQAVPADIGDVIDMVSPYAPKTGWVDLGATKEAFSYHRSFDTSGWEIQQVAGNVIEELTNLTRRIGVSIAEFRKELLRIIEGDNGSVTAIAASAGKSAQDKISFGSFSSLSRYRFAFISRRSKQSGLVTEPGGAERGRFFAGIAYSAQLTAEEVTSEQNKGDLSAAGVNFGLYPDPSGTFSEGEEYGCWLDEKPGTIA